MGVKHLVAIAAQQWRSIGVITHGQLQRAAVNCGAQPARQIEHRLQLCQQLAHLAAEDAWSGSGLLLTSHVAVQRVNFRACNKVACAHI